MASVLVVVHPERQEAVELARHAIEWLTARGHGARIVDDAVAADVGDDVAVLEASEAARGADLAVALGGDGTMLRTVELACPEGVPVLGVNLGQLGYLAAVEPSRLREALERFLAGEYELDERLSLDVTTASGRRLQALNEAVLEKTVPGHTVRLALTIAGERFMTYAADGLIVATPTGSTAYNLSARGPILSPQLDAILVTPVSPHMLFDRSLVVMPTDVVRIDVLDGRPAVLVVDGVESGVLQPGDAVECRASARRARLVVIGEPPRFHSILRAKFQLPDR